MAEQDEVRNAVAHYAANMLRQVTDRAATGRLVEWLSDHLAIFPELELESLLDQCPRTDSSRRAGREMPPHVLSALINGLDRAAAGPVGGQPLARTLALVRRQFQLSKLDIDILRLLILYEEVPHVERLCDESTMGMADLAAVVANLLGVKLAAVNDRLRPQAPLRDGGLLRVVEDHGDLAGRRGQFQIAKPLVECIRNRVADATELRQGLLGTPCNHTLEWADFEHLGGDRDLVAGVIQGALAAGEAGINILLYGPPGTGKTEFSKTVAAALGLELYAVGERSDSGGEPARADRMLHLRVNQRVVAGAHNCALLFDEAEDIFARGLSGEVSGSKVFIHRLMEGTPVPVFWTANSVGALPEPVRRRMTLAIEIKVPNATVRERVWHRLLDKHGVTLSDGEVRGLAQAFPAAPALAENAVRAARLAGGGEQVIRRAVEGTRRVVTGRRAAPDTAAGQSFDPALVSAALDLHSLAGRLAAGGGERRFSLCLYGPPGTGKSFYVRDLAERLGIEVMQKRTSDLLSPFVGETEQRIAQAFEEAREQGAFLVFDEADSLLADRRGAVRSWEITQVNEMLTWMESHPLPFACTTNLMDSLDTAALRRFTFKVEFRALTRRQALSAFAGFFAATPPEDLRLPDNLTPGDFAVVRRKAAILGLLGDVAALTAMLAEESAVKPAPARSIGFCREV